MRRLLSFGLGLLLVAAALELIARALPVSSTTHTGYTLDATVRTYPVGHRFTIATGWDLRNPQRLRANNAGFAAEHDFLPDRNAVALIGDSHVEGSALPHGDRVAPLLESQLGASRRVYAFGSPGTSLLDYAETARYADRHFGVGDLVFLLSVGDIRQSVCGSGQVAGPCVRWPSAEPATDQREEANLLKQVARQSALAHYVFGQLKARPEDLPAALRSMVREFVLGAPPVAQPAAPKPTAPSEQMLAMERRIGELFFERLAPYRAGRRVIIALHHGAAREPAEANDLTRFAALAGQEGAIVIDLAPAYAAQRRRSPRSLVIGPYDGHNNRLGNAVLAQEIAARLNAGG